MATILTNPQTAVGSASAVLSNQRVIDMSNDIALLEPTDAPLTVFSKRAGQSESCFNPEYSWLEDVLAPKVVTADTAGYASGATTVNVVAGDGKKFNTYDLVKIPSTGEIMLVTAIATDALTVTRAFGTTAAGAIGVSEVLLIIGNAQKENDSSRLATATQTVNGKTYYQINGQWYEAQ